MFSRLVIVLTILYSGINAQVYESWFQQHLDNFNTSDSRDWLNRYFTNEEFAQPGGQIFIYVGAGPDVLERQWMEHGNMFDIARELNATFFALEHRFYGESRPLADVSVASLKYLTTEQYMADLENFIAFIKESRPTNGSKIILYGDALGATVSVWMRQQYPDLVDGVWASNSRLLAQYPDFRQYFVHFGDNIISAGGMGCYEKFQQVWEEIDVAFETGNTTEVEEAFKLCVPPDPSNRLDLAIFGGVIIESMDKAIRRSTYARVADFCEIIQSSEHSTALAAFGYYFDLIFGGGDGCVPASYDLLFPSVSSEEWGAEAVNQGIRQWFWQACTEYGTFRSTDSPFQPFSNLLPGEIWQEMCEILFGVTSDQIREGVEFKNARYGGLNPNVTNVYFTNSGMNSFRFLTPLSNLNPLAPSDTYPREGQLSDLRSIDEVNDSAELLAIKRRLWNLVYQWLGIEDI